jgi:hypothetical protein
MFIPGGIVVHDASRDVHARGMFPQPAVKASRMVARDVAATRNPETLPLRRDEGEGRVHRAREVSTRRP